MYWIDSRSFFATVTINQAKQQSRASKARLAECAMNYLWRYKKPTFVTGEMALAIPKSRNVRKLSTRVPLVLFQVDSFITNLFITNNSNSTQIHVIYCFNTCIGKRYSRETRQLGSNYYCDIIVLIRIIKNKVSIKACNLLVLWQKTFFASLQERKRQIYRNYLQTVSFFLDFFSQLPTWVVHFTCNLCFPVFARSCQMLNNCLTNCSPDNTWALWPAQTNRIT